jgi:RNA polymerase sigma-70 factor, ECF subfamily
MEPFEADVWQRCLVGHDDALRHLWRACHEAIRAQLRNSKVDRQDADDLAQALYVSLTEDGCRRLRTFSPAEAFNPWLTTCARHLIIGRLRCRLARPHEVFLEEQLGVAHDVAGSDDTQDAALTRLEAISVLAELRSTLLMLGSLEREAFRLHAFEGKSYTEIAAELGVPTVTVRMRCSRARGHLRKLIAARREQELGPDGR